MPKISRLKIIIHKVIRTHGIIYRFPNCKPKEEISDVKVSCERKRELVNAVIRLLTDDKLTMNIK